VFNQAEPKKRKGERRFRSYDRALNTIDKRIVSIIIIHIKTIFNRESLNGIENLKYKVFHNAENLGITFEVRYYLIDRYFYIQKEKLA
jgi:hypothetical protein